MKNDFTAEIARLRQGYGGQAEGAEYMNKLKKLPNGIQMKPVGFEDGGSGYAKQVSRNEEYGITITASRQATLDPWRIRFEADILPDEAWDSYKDLRIAYNTKIEVENE